MLMLCVVLSIFVYGMIASTLGTILPNLSERFALSPRQNGVIAFAQALGLILASLAVGPVLDAEGTKIGLILSLVGVIIALASLPRCSGYKSILGWMFLMGAGGGILITAANALAAEISGPRRASVLNLANLFFGLGGLLTPFIAANLFGKKWNRLCDSIAGFALVALAVILFTPMTRAQAAHHPSFASAAQLLTQPELLLLGLFLFLYVACEVGTWNWLPRHLIAQGIPEGHALNILSLGFGMGLLLGRLAVAPILIHLSASVVLASASAAMCLTTYLMPRVRRTWSAIAVVASAGLAMASVYPTTLAIVGGRFPEMTATALGIVITCGWIGLAVSSRLIGSMAGGDSNNLRKALLVLPSFSFVMLIISLSLLKLGNL